jgi:hypothetical protein
MTNGLGQLTVIKADSRRKVRMTSPTIPLSILSEGVTQMMQKLFESSENLAVAYGVVLFIVFHFGMLFLFELV